MAAILKNRCDDNRPITTKFGKQMQKDMPMTMHRSKSKPEIKFQYGDRPFSKTGSSFISATDWDISSKFGMQIHFRLLKQIPSLNVNPEVHYRLYGRHLEKSIWRHNSADYFPITTKFGRQTQIMCRWLHMDENRNRKQNFNMAAVRFPKPEIFISQPWIKIYRRNVACKYSSTFLNRYHR